MSFEIATAATQGDAKKNKKPNNREPIRFSEPGLRQHATLAEKKELALQIKKLPREGFKEVINMAYEGKPHSDEFNLENLPLAKIRELQKYIRQKGQTTEQENSQRLSNHVQERSEESSFESDSDS